MFHLQKFRKFLASMHLGILVSILTSGAIFMHKHKTSDGEIVIHTHPYKIGENPIEKTHHQSEGEIHYFDVLYSGSFLITESNPINFTLFNWIEKEYTNLIPSDYYQTLPYSHYLRGPPIV